MNAFGSIHLVSASAGSGKTFRLARELEQAITGKEKRVRPEAVIATTFTVKAAAELRERVRSRLLEAGRVEEAQRLGAARIGTVNAVCAQIVADFAFDLGISPEVQVLDETAADKAFAQALSSVISVARDEDGAALTAATDAGAALMELAERWPNLEWQKDVREIANRARANALGPGDLRACAGRSADSLLAWFGPEDEDGDKLEAALKQALGDFLAAPPDGTKTTAKVAVDARYAHSRLAAGRPLSWWYWAKLATAEPAVKSQALYEPVRAAARGHERHPVLRREIRRCVELVFEVAAQALEAYERHKREWGLIDFVDQERQALDLLKKPEVRDMLREQVDLVLVDEFQDTSPLQLAIFVALAGIAPRSVWVGDQKQSIYGFRGTDPALMDAAIEAIVGKAGSDAYETLPHSWRSRAELVHLTSDVFAPAFEAQGIPQERVRLQPAPDIAARPDTMGPIVEAWLLNTKNADDDAAAVAAGVRELLDDGDARVRDVMTSEERRVRAGDIGVLCRSNENCERVTRALEAIGIHAVRPRAGLMSTPEARLALAALRLWVEPGQPLAAAEIGRLLVQPDQADAWLETVIEAPGAAYVKQAECVRIAEASQRLALAGPLVAFDEAIEAAGAREACLRWGRSGQRLANLDALRAFAHRYVAACETEGEAATVAGLVAYLAGLVEDKQDAQATLSGEDAVTVSTLHGAKGLEWPVTVLHDIDASRKPTAFGVHVASEREAFDFDEPLAGRWIRYWPDPYAPQSQTSLHQSVRGGPEHAKAERRDTRETLRLLYVGWTRARDRLVLAGRPGKVIGRTLGLLRDRSGNPLICEPAPSCVWAGRTVTPKIRSTQPISGSARVHEPGLGYDAAGSREFPPATADMSGLSGAGTLGEVRAIGTAPFVQPPVDWTALGSAVHTFMAADRPGLDAAERLAMASGALERWSVQGSLQPAALAAASDSLRAFVSSRWPAFSWHREWPVRLRAESGTELVGYADLVLVDGDSFVLIDHKCPGGTRDEALAACAGYAGQLGAYARAIAEATGKRTGGCFVHLITHGLVVEIKGRRQDVVLSGALAVMTEPI